MDYSKLNDSEKEKLLEDLIESHGRIIKRTIIGIIKDYDNADDIYNRTLENIYFNMNSFRGEASLPTLSYVIARNASFNFLARRKTQRYLRLNSDYIERILDQVKKWGRFNRTSTINKDNLMIMKDAKKNPEETILFNELMQYVERIVNTLRNPQIFKMRYIEGLTNLEIAKITGINNKHVSKQLYEMRPIFQEKMKNYMGAI